MRRTTRIAAVVAAVLAMLGVLTGAAGAAPAGQSGSAGGTHSGPARTDSIGDCPDGFSCYYDGYFEQGRIFIAPSCGFFDLGGYGLNDRISEIINNGQGAVQPYNWDGVSSWIPVGDPVQVGQVRLYFGADNNVIDAISIAC
jgi:hypothetical protein